MGGGGRLRSSDLAGLLARDGVAHPRGRLDLDAHEREQPAEEGEVSLDEPRGDAFAAGDV